MNEEAIKLAYDLFVADGYTKSIDEFKKLMRENPNGREVAYNLFVNDGYKKSIDDFSSLMGATESVGVTPGAEFPVKKKKKMGYRHLWIPHHNQTISSRLKKIISQEDLVIS